MVSITASSDVDNVSHILPINFFTVATLALPICGVPPLCSAFPASGNKALCWLVKSRQALPTIC